MTERIFSAYSVLIPRNFRAYAKEIEHPLSDNISDEDILTVNKIANLFHDKEIITKFDRNIDEVVIRWLHLGLWDLTKSGDFCNRRGKCIDINSDYPKEK